MKFHFVAREGEGIDSWWQWVYGLGYYDFRTSDRHYFPFPFNWIVRFYRDFSTWFNYTLMWRNWEDKIASDIRKSKRDGYREGYKHGKTGEESRYGF